jgi:thioredoxin 1
MNIKHLLLTIATLLAATAAQALEVKPYTEASFAQAQTAGKPTALHFHASWCPTCKKQSSSIELLKADNDLNLTVFVADYDLEEPLKKKLGVTSQSTLIVYKGTAEKARSVAKNSPEAIKADLRTAL